MIVIKRTSFNNVDFIKLVELLNTYLKVKDGEEHLFYDKYNNINVLKHVIVAYADNKPVACGDFKVFNQNTIEIKRMFTDTRFRGKGIASKILQELEQWAKESFYNVCILETGKRQEEAVSFYKKMDYIIIPNYGQYKNIDNSVCFKKIIN